MTQSEASPVPCLKERPQFIIPFQIEDYSLDILCKRLKLNYFYFFEIGMDMEIGL